MNSRGGRRESLMRFIFWIMSATLVAPIPASANECTSDLRIQRAENGLLPRVSLKENLGHTASITQRMRELGIPGAGIAVIDEGKVVCARAYGLSDIVEKTPATTETLFQAGSISKPVAALGALRLVKEGKLSLDANVNSKLKTWRVPDNEFTGAEKVTLRRLLSHTAGLTVHGFPGYAVGSQIPTVMQVLNGEPPANTLPVRVDVRPGSTYRYSGGGYTVMQLLMADVSNESFESFMQSKVLDVLGMKSSTYAQNPPAALAGRRASGHRPDGERIAGKLHVYPEMAAAGLWTTPADLSRYLIYVQAAVRGDTGPLLDPSLAKELVERQNGGHGLGPEIYEIGEFSRFGHNGVDEGFEAAMVAYVAQGKGLVIMVNTNGAFMFFDEIKGSVARAYGWPEFPARLQLAAERFSESALKRVPGKYRISPTITAVVSAREGRLFFETPDDGEVEIFAKNAVELFSPALGPNTLHLVEFEGRIAALKTADGLEYKRIE